MLITKLKKMVIFIFVLIFFIAFTLFFIVISEHGCFYGTNKIRVNELIIVTAKERDINYCNMLRKSLKNEDDFAKFVSLEFYDGSGIEHSDVVYQLYRYYGSELFWKKASSLSDDEKKLVQSYLDYAISENEVYGNYN